ncbi:MAG: hypothetical protein V4519_00580 [Patescibacteria group bacterium]
MATVLSAIDVGRVPTGIDDRKLVLGILTYLVPSAIFTEVSLLKVLGEAAGKYSGSMFIPFRIGPEQTSSRRMTEIVNGLTGQGYLQRWGKPTQLMCKSKVAQETHVLRAPFNPTQQRAFGEIAARIVELAENKKPAKQGG